MLWGTQLIYLCWLRLRRWRLGKRDTGKKGVWGVCVCARVCVYACVSVYEGVSPGWTVPLLSMLLYLVVFVFNEHLSDTSQKLNRGRNDCRTVVMDCKSFVSFLLSLNLWQSASTICVCVCLLASADRCVCVLSDSLSPNVLAGLHTGKHTRWSR